MNAKAGSLSARRELLVKYIDRQMETGKWLLCSLLIVNGGAIGAMLSNAQIGQVLLQRSSAWFIGGIIFAFFSGVVTWLVSDVQISKLEEISDNQLLGSVDRVGDLFSDRIARLLQPASFLFALISLGCFSSGAYIASQSVNANAISTKVLAGTRP